jgi:hypothetical protein
MNRTSLIAMGIVGSSLTLMVGNYDPDLTMLTATVLLLAFGIVTPTQGKAPHPAVTSPVEGAYQHNRPPGPDKGPLVARLQHACRASHEWSARHPHPPTHSAQTPLPPPPDPPHRDSLPLLSPSAWAGFSNTGVITVAAMFVVARCIEVSGTIDWLTRKSLGLPKNRIIAQLRYQIPTVIVSIFTPNTPQVAAMIPVTMAWTTRIRMSPAQFMVSCAHFTTAATYITPQLDAHAPSPSLATLALATLAWARTHKVRPNFNV